MVQLINYLNKLTSVRSPTKSSVLSFPTNRMVGKPLTLYVSAAVLYNVASILATVIGCLINLLPNSYLKHRCILHERMATKS